MGRYLYSVNYLVQYILILSAHVIVFSLESPGVQLAAGLRTRRRSLRIEITK